MSQGTTPNVILERNFSSVWRKTSLTHRSGMLGKDFSASRPLSASPFSVPQYRCCGVGGGTGFRGNISGRFAVMYTNDATITAICFMSGS